MPGMERSREARFGIVMYGGVSLAIYINGVSQELFRAVRGSGIYKLLKTCLDTDVVVDIISGTSAGGINGLFLAYALLNDKDFARTKNLWREHGDFSRLLQRVDLDPKNCKSLLNSDEYYRTQMKKAFDDLHEHPLAPDGSMPSFTKEMDVFITGTSFYPDEYTTFDDAGRPIEMLEYRKTFKLKHRSGRANEGPFRPADDDQSREDLHQSLAKLARVTSCFPAAFLPVRVLVKDDWDHIDRSKDDAPYAREPEVDGKLCEWGAVTKSTYFLDGGVLNNKPFTPTIDAIFGRTADRPVDRTLFYVEPDPETPDNSDAPAPQKLCEPTFLSAIINGTIGIGTYQSTTDDAKLLEEHNSEVVRHNAVCAELKDKFDKLGKLATGVTIPPEELLPDPQRSLYLNARNVQLASRGLRGALRENGAEPHMTSAAEREQVKKLFESLKHRGPADMSYDETFRRYDVYFRLRRLHQTTHYLFCAFSNCATSPDVANEKLLHGLNRHIHLLEIVQYWLETAVDRAPVRWKNPPAGVNAWDHVWRQLRCLLDEVLRVSDEDRKALPRVDLPAEQRLSAPELDVFHEWLRGRVETVLVQCKDGITVQAVQPDAPPFYGLLQWTDQIEADFIQQSRSPTTLYDEARKEYDEFVNLDAVVFPPDYLSSLKDFNEVRLMRIGPTPTLDREYPGGIGFRGTSGAADKLAGRSLAHFSGFLKRSWRSNDILWGRLDALRHLVISLLANDKLDSLRKNDSLKNKIRANLAAMGGARSLIDEVFPDSPARSRELLADFFDKLLTLPANDPLNVAPNLNLLVEMGQLQVLYEEVGGVLCDAAQQQAEWNRYEKPSARPGPAPAAAQAHPQQAQPAAEAGRAAQAQAARAPAAEFTSPAGYIDPALVGLHAEVEIATLMTQWKQSAPSAASPKQTGIGSYFEERYSIAAEGSKEGMGLPPLVLAEYLTHSALVANNCILGAIPQPRRRKITSHPIYFFCLQMPLRLSHGLIGLWTRSPGTRVLTYTAAVAAALTALIIAVLAWEGLFLHQNLSWASVALVVIPLLLLWYVTGRLWRMRKTYD